MKGRKLLIVLAVIFVAANVADILLTWLALRAGGAEVNPIMGAVISGGWPRAVALKVALPAVIALVLVRQGRLAMLAVLAGAFTLITGWNVAGLLLF
jgi:hypothetical protein